MPLIFAQRVQRLLPARLHRRVYFQADPWTSSIA
jgi:hypothetical protein